MHARTTTPLPRRTRRYLEARRQALAAPLPGAEEGIADTYGWDTVFAIRLDDVNRAIVNEGTTPESFQVTRSDAGREVGLDGRFAPWQVVPGGDGQNLHLALPIPSLAYADGQKLKRFDDVLALVEVRLSLVPQPRSAGPGAGRGSWMDLVLHTGTGPPAATAGEAAAAAAGLADAGPAGSKAVYVLDLEFDGEVEPEDFDQAFISYLLGEWLNDPEHLQEFNHAFAAVDLGARAAVEAFQWMMPTHVSYAVADHGSLESSVFALLCMTEDRDADGLAHQVSPFAIPEDQRAGMLISPERFLTRLLLPGIGVMFSGPVEPETGRRWPEDYFAVDAKDGSITNLAAIQIEKFQPEEEGATYVADLGKGNLKVRLYNSYLETQMIDLHHRLNHFMSWLHVYHTINSRSTLRLTDQLIDLLPGGGEHRAVVTKDKAAQWIEVGVLSAMVVGMAAWAAARGIGSAAGRVASTTETAASITAEATVSGEITAAQSAALATEGAGVALSGLRAGVVRADQFLEGWQVANRAALLVKVTGLGLGVAQILEKLADVHFQDSMPKFAEFVAGMMAPVRWPAAESDFTVELARINRAFQIGGDPGFAH